MTVRRLPAVKVRLPRKPAPILPAPVRPDAGRDEPEILAGTVHGRKASAPEERLARALEGLNSVDMFYFRYTVGAPRGLPGWKEIDYLVHRRGMVYAVEVDTAFTHRDKGRADKLHDAIILKALAKQGLQVYPEVIHIDGETELADKESAERTAKELFS